jgi:hypothetical protein
MWWFSIYFGEPYILTHPSGRLPRWRTCIVVILLSAVPHAVKMSVIDFHSFLTIWQMPLNTRARRLSVRFVEFGDLLANRPSCVNWWCDIIEYRAWGCLESTIQKPKRMNCHVNAVNSCYLSYCNGRHNNRPANWYIELLDVRLDRAVLSHLPMYWPVLTV